jgi:hypothetical protein
MLVKLDPNERGREAFITGVTQEKFPCLGRMVA